MSGTIDPSLFALFAEVVASGGVRGAAARTGTPRSSVSRKLAALEARLGSRLLQRNTRTVTLTEEGRVLYDRVRPALVALGDAESALRSLRDRPVGTLRLTAPPLFADLFLGAPLASYARRYPEVRVSLHLTDEVVSLVDEGYDCALRAGRLPDSSLVARLLGRGSQRVYASPDYLRARGEPTRPSQLAAHDALVFSGRKQPERWSFVARGRRVTVTVRARVTANSLLVTRDLARAGLGLAMLPAFIAHEPVRRGELREVLGGYDAPRGAMYAVFPSEQHLAPRTRAFVDLLVEHFAANPLDP